MEVPLYSHLPGHFGTLTSWSVFQSALVNKVGNRPVNVSIDQTSGHYWL